MDDDGIMTKKLLFKASPIQQFVSDRGTCVPGARGPRLHNPASLATEQMAVAWVATCALGQDNLDKIFLQDLAPTGKCFMLPRRQAQKQAQLRFSPVNVKCKGAASSRMLSAMLRMFVTFSFRRQEAGLACVDHIPLVTRLYTANTQHRITASSKQFGFWPLVIY